MQLTIGMVRFLLFNKCIRGDIMNKRQNLILIPILLILSVLFAFQNCASDFEDGAYIGSSTTPDGSINVSASSTSLVANGFDSITTITWTSTGLNNDSYRCYTSSSGNGCSFTRWLDCNNADDDDPIQGSQGTGHPIVTAPTNVTYTVTCIGPSGPISDSVTVTWTPPAASDAPVISAQPQSLDLNLNSSTTQELSVTVAEPTSNVTYQWYKLDPATGNYNAMADKTASKIDIFLPDITAPTLPQKHYLFNLIKGTYQVRINRGASQTISQAAEINYAQSGQTTATFTSSCNKTEKSTVGSTTWAYNGSLTKSVNLTTGIATYSAHKLYAQYGPLTANSCNEMQPRNDGRDYSRRSSTTSPAAECFRENSGNNAQGRLEFTDAGIRVVASYGENFMSATAASVSTHFCTAEWVLQ